MASLPCSAQPSFKGLEHLFVTPKHYIIEYTSTQPVIDGNISDTVWKSALWSDYFKDIEGDTKPEPYYKTRFKMLWDQKYLYIAADIEDQNIWAYLRNHDDIVYRDNDFELFIDPDNNTYQYFEIEVNAINTIFDLFLSKPYRNNSHELMSWNANGIHSAVKVHGTLNKPSDKDKGWTVEMAIPYNAITLGGNVFVPKDGDLWRINFSRVEWETTVQNKKYIKKIDSNGKALPENNWVWSPQGIINMHYPERWGYLLFSSSDSKNKSFELPYSEKQRQYLWLVYYRQKEYLSKNKRYASTLDELGITPASFAIDGILNVIKMEATEHLFYATIRSSDNNKILSIDNEGLIETGK